MDRPDLRDDYTTLGWQVLDATPREVGNLISTTTVTGPACVRAVKDKKDLPFGTKYVIDELNTNIKYFFQPEDSFKSVEPDDVLSRGLLVTKDVGQFSMADITESFKFIKASRKGKDITSLIADRQRFIGFSVVPSKNLKYGQEITFTLTAKPPTSDSYTVSVVATIHPEDYIGRVGKVVKMFKDQKVMQTREQGLKAKCFDL